MNARRIAVMLASSLAAAAAHGQVVADSACEKHAIDIASFATCDSPTRVARAEPPAPRPTTTPAEPSRKPAAAGAAAKSGQRRPEPGAAAPPVARVR